MAAPDQIIQQIRFGIEQLSARNGQYEFEALCRHLCRARVASNILPGTGPVAAYGDQGRDFENIAGEPPITPAMAARYAARADPRPTSFACSLNKAFEAKIYSDVESILSKGDRPERIVFFSGTEVVIGKRHEIIDKVRKDHGIELVIVDAPAIAEFLADHEIFWIAERYLSIPAEIFPRPSGAAAWYEETLARWKSGQGVLNYEGFSEVREAIRHATAERDHNVDIEFWIQQLEAMRTKTQTSPIWRRCTYEINRAALRGQGTLVGREADLRAYFDAIPTLRSPVELQDANTLLDYCAPAILTGYCRLDPQEVSRYREQLTKRVEEELASPVGPSTRGALLELRGHAALSIDPQEPKLPDFDKALIWWTKLLDVLPEAPMYPVAHFADRLNKIIGLAGATPAIVAFSEKLDPFVAQRHGDHAAGSNARHRAIALFKAGQLLGAIRHTHRARAAWMKGETLRGSILSSLLLADLYRRLGLLLASKYHALGAAELAIHSQDVIVLAPRGLADALTADYLVGAHRSYLAFLPVVLNSFRYLTATDKEADRLEQGTILHTITLDAIAHRLDPVLAAFVAKETKDLGLDDYMIELAPKTRQAWAGKTDDQVIETFATTPAGAPFNDVEHTRQVKWRALGIDWDASWASDRHMNALAEEFVAQLQILTAELGDTDLIIAPTSITLLLQEGPAMDVQAEHGNAERAWRITLAPTDGAKIEDRALKLVGAITFILQQASLLAEEDLMKRISQAFEEDLASKLALPGTYETIYLAFMPEHKLAINGEPGLKKPALNVAAFEHPELAWKKTPIVHNPKEIERALKRRYEEMPRPIKLLLPQLVADAGVAAVIRTLRREGYLDWQILAALAGVAVNYRLRLKHGPTYTEEVARDFMTHYARDEQPDDPQVPITEYTEDTIRLNLQSLMLSSLKVLDLECRQELPDFPAITRLLRERYAYFTDDIPHPDPFPGLVP